MGLTVFHIYLVLKNTTTHEFLRKTWKNPSFNPYLKSRMENLLGVYRIRAVKRFRWADQADSMYERFGDSVSLHAVSASPVSETIIYRDLAEINPILTNHCLPRNKVESEDNLQDPE